MRVYAIRSVMLTTNTASAWKEAGVRFARRGWSTNDIMHIYRENYDAVLNLGKSDFHPEEREGVWNHGTDIKPLIYPGHTRKLLGQYMPPRPTEFPAEVWVKAPGAHGRGKQKKVINGPLDIPNSWDWCKHVEGQEYRIISVGHRLVQDYLRLGDNGDRSYHWIAMKEVPYALKAMVRSAAAQIPGNNVLAWDAVVDNQGQPFIFEANTCPGVNVETVQRIVKEMERQTNGT
jgi:hypothetical protein